MANFKDIGDGIFIGPQPTPQDLIEAKQRGVETVIDMRMPGESPTSNKEITEASGLGYINIPVDKTALEKGQIDALTNALKTAPGPYLLHCATGARAALLLTLGRAKQLGWTPDHVFAEAKAIGFDLQESEVFAGFVRKVTAH